MQYLHISLIDLVPVAFPAARDGLALEQVLVQPQHELLVRRDDVLRPRLVAVQAIVGCEVQCRPYRCERPGIGGPSGKRSSRTVPAAVPSLRQSSRSLT